MIQKAISLNANTQKKQILAGVDPIFTRVAVLWICFFTAACGMVLPAYAADENAPDYVVIHLSVQVNRPAEQVWKRVGDYCEIAEWLKVTCRYASGSGDVGTVRVINGTTLEPMTGKTRMSYTYWQTQGTMAPDSYHGTLAVDSNGDATSTIYYMLFYNQNAIPAEKRESEHQRLTTRFQGALDAMKALAEAQK